MARRVLITSVTTIFGAAFLLGVLFQRQIGLWNLFLFFNGGCVLNQESVELKGQHQGKLSIFILAGQSNMEGAGELADFDPLDTREQAYVFTEDYKRSIARVPVKNNKVEPCVAFAKTLIEGCPGKIVGLVNCARRGTSIDQWSKSLDENSLYLNMIKRALAASSQGKIEGILFYQGENDTEVKPTDHYKGWDEIFKKFVSDVRNDLKNDSFPIIFAQIGKGLDNKWLTLKERQKAVQIIM